MSNLISVLTDSALEALISPEFNFRALRLQLTHQIANREQNVALNRPTFRDASPAFQNSPEILPGNLVAKVHIPSQPNASHIQSETSALSNSHPPVVDQLLACNQVALALWQAGNYNEAQKLYSTLLEARPDLAIGLLSSNFGAGAFEFFDPENSLARDAFATAVTFQPSLWRTYFTLSQGYFLAGRYQEAILHFNHLLELQPGGTAPELYTVEDTSLLYKLRAFGYLQTKKYLAMAQDATAALTLIPSDATAYELRGLAGMLIGQWNRAKTDFDSAIWLGAESSDNILFNRGLVHLRLGSLANAREDFGRAFQLNPDERSVAGFMEQWCGYCLDHKGWARRPVLTTPRDSITSNLNSNGDYSTSRARAALTTTSRSIMAERLVRVTTTQSNYWSDLAGVALEFLRNDFNQAFSKMTELETQYHASERPGLAGWAYCYWLGLLNLASGRSLHASEWLRKALELGLPPVLLLDGMTLD